jgi:UDP-2,3-diacylglucosamine pyrophosphatase LpxH
MSNALSQVVVLSDIHIGDTMPTTWYQPAVHDRYLEAICAWIIERADTVAEVVLLGDVVDFWTVPADRRPPTFAAILQANPQIFGPTGFFGRLLDAVAGRVTYLPGNHDMGITAAEVSQIVSPAGHRMRYHPGPYHPAANAEVVLAHGNSSTMFNAPDPTSPWAGLPVGHFVTRMVASAWARRLPPGKTVADLPDQGAPDGLDYWSIAWGCFSRLDVSVTGALLDSVATQTGTGPSDVFVMPDGSTTTLTQVHALYDDLFTRWVAAEGGGEIGQLITWKAVLADARAYYMGWFAQRLAVQTGARVVGFGHTHAPVLGLDTRLVGYVNSGFGCPSLPDMPDNPITFATIDLTTAAATVWRCSSAGGPPQISPYAVPPASPVPVGMDDSCYVRLINHTGGPVTLVPDSARTDPGYWVARPPEVIPAGGTGSCWVQDFPGAEGSGARFTYAAADGTRHDFSVACPSLLFHWNSCHGGTSFRTRSGSDPWGPPGQIAKSGHPFYVEFTL